MKTMPFYLSVLCFFILCFNAFAESREWNWLGMKYYAKLIRISEDGKTVFLLRNGKEDLVKFEQLSEKDREYLVPRMAHFAPASKSTPIGVSDVESLEDTLKKAQDGDVILVKKGSYRIENPLRISKSITIKGEGADPEDTVLESEQGSVFVIDSEYKYMNFENLLFRVKETKKIDESEDATDEEREKVCRLRRSSSAIAIHNGNPIFVNCHFESKNGGFGFYVKGKQTCPLVKKCKFSNSMCGLVFEDHASGIFEQCTIFNNDSHGVQLGSSECTFDECESRKNGGSGILLLEDSTCKLNNCNINNNSGGGINAYDSVLDAYKCVIRLNGETALIFMRSRGWVSQCDLAEHKNCEVHLSDKSKPTLWGCKIHSGTVGIRITDESTANLKNCEIFGQSSAGIAVNEGANPTIESCKIFKNVFVGLIVSESGKGSILNCEIMDNKYGIWVDVEQKQEYPIIKKCKVQNNECGLVYKTQYAGTYTKNIFKGNKQEKAWNKKEDARGNAEADRQTGAEFQGPTKRTCPVCKGHGTEAGKCTSCSGSGFRFGRDRGSTCDKCYGAGTKQCSFCNGVGRQVYNSLNGLWVPDK